MADKPNAGMSPFNADAAKIMNLPFMPDMQALMEAQRRNIAALTAANQAAIEGTRAAAQRNFEIIQQTMAELTDSMLEMAGPETPQEKAARQTEMIRRAYERAAANIKEVGGIIQHASAEAVKVLNQRFTAAMDEVKALTRTE